MDDSLGTAPEKLTTPAIWPDVMGSTLTNDVGFDGEEDESEAGCDRWLQPQITNKPTRQKEEIIFMAF